MKSKIKVFENFAQRADTNKKFNKCPYILKRNSTAKLKIRNCNTVGDFSLILAQGYKFRGCNT
jgi:hypothetical protein